jgi:hypothetical protein
VSSGTLTVVNRCRCTIAPPSLLLTVAEQGDAETRDAALRTLLTSVALRARRSSFGPTLRRFGLSPADLDFLPAQVPDTGPENTVYDVAGGEEQALSGRLVRGTTDPPTGDAAVDEAFDGAAATADFYREEFDRDSVDDRGLDLVSSVHFGQRYDCEHPVVAAVRGLTLVMTGPAGAFALTCRLRAAATSCPLAGWAVTS